MSKELANTRAAVITVTRKRPNGKIYRETFLVDDAEELETPEDIIPIAAQMFKSWREEVTEHPSPEEKPPSTIITFPGA